jgi:hypothetical protein
LEIDRIRSQQFRESCDIQPINEWVERRREWEEHVTRMEAERLVKITRDHIPAGRRMEGLNPWLNRRARLLKRIILFFAVRI